jgi:hypothetical protein
MTSTRRSPLVRILSAVCLFAVSLGIGVVVGFAEDRVYILGMGAVLVGVGVGVAAGFQMYFAAPWSRIAVVCLLLATASAAVIGLHAGRLQADRRGFDRVFIEASQEGFIRSSDADALESSPSAEELAIAWNRHLEDEIGETGWAAHLRLRATMGVRVLGNRGLEGPPWFAWIVWFLEWAVVSVSLFSVTSGVRERGVKASKS